MDENLKQNTCIYKHHYSFVKRMLANPMTKGKVIVLVEGDDDVLVYDKLFIHSFAIVKAAPEENGVRGCRYVELVTKDIIAQKPNSALVGIRDADYTKWLPRYVLPTNVFRTDEHDMEMMLMRGANVSQSLDTLKQGAAEKWNWLRDNICVPRGQMRLLNDVLDLKCSFKDRAKISNLWDFSHGSVLKEGWKTFMETDFIRNCNPQKGIKFTPNAMSMEIAKLKLNNFPWYEICQGHDSVKALQYELNDSKINEDIITKTLRKAYSVMDFHNTHLCNDLIAFSRKLGMNIVR